MPRFARVKEDGYIMSFNENMDPKKFDFFEHPDRVVPEFIADLPAFLSGSKDEAVTAKPRNKTSRPEPVFLKNGDGTKA